MEFLANGIVAQYELKIAHKNYPQYSDSSTHGRDFLGLL
jgi:hypothetical protein